MNIIFSLMVFLLSVNVLAVEVIIRPDEIKKEEPKEEPTLELPKPAQFNVNAVNLSGVEFIIKANIKAADKPYRWIWVQNVAAPNTTTTLSTLFAEPGTSFEFVQAEVWMSAGDLQGPITCTIEPPKVDEPKFEAPPADDKPAEPAAASEAPSSDPIPTISKKSIDFIFFVPPNQSYPQCRIYFDQTLAIKQ